MHALELWDRPEDAPGDGPQQPAAPPLTDAQREIVEWPGGPLVVIAGAGTGKTRVIVERVRWLLERHGPVPGVTSLPPEAADVAADPFAGPVLPEQILVLTYNVAAARELGDRIEAAVGPAVRARATISNFHAFCHRVLTECAADAGLPPRPDVLDGVGQLLLLRDIRPSLPLLYYAGGGNPFWVLGSFVEAINRAKDELVDPDAFDAFVEHERQLYELRTGDYAEALERLARMGTFDPLRPVRTAYAELRRHEMARQAGDPAADPRPERVEREADKEARRTVGGSRWIPDRDRLSGPDQARADALRADYVRDGAALEILRLSELALVYRAYQEELARRGALDFGEQIGMVTQLLKRRPNVLRRYQRQYRFILVDEFQDANIAQIELVELLGRTPDRPDEVMVVGDDDQSIYRFRGASFAAFAEHDRRFSGPPAHDPAGPAPGPPPRRRIEHNFRSRPAILTVANRLIGHNELRIEPDKRLVPIRDRGGPVELVTCAGPEDEASAIVERIRQLAGWDPAVGGEPAMPWSSFAVLYRKHKHRDAIVARLREEGIPHVVSGGLSLFSAPEIRDLEQSLRAIGDPHADVALARMLSAGPWRLDALELLELTRAASRSERHLVDVVRDLVATGRRSREHVHPDGEQADLVEPAPGSLQARLRRAIELLDELHGTTWREGPFTVLQRFLEVSGTVADLLAVDTLEARRAVANIASLLRFAADWQREHPAGTLAGFVAYLDAYQAAGGELPTSVEAVEQAAGVRLMTLYQAKGLEYPVVFVPQLLADEWPTRPWSTGLFPRQLLREAVPLGDVHTEEERRLLYVAITRARDRVILLTHGGPLARAEPSVFVGEIAEGAGPELVQTDRASAAATADEVDPGSVTGLALAPSPRDRRQAHRLRAVELLDLLEGVDPADPEASEARAALLVELARLGESVVTDADAARSAGLDPLTLRTVGAAAGAGVSLLDVAPLPDAFSYSQLSMHERCGLQYALSYLYRLPGPDAVAAFSFGSAAHAAFEAFTRERRERAARGDPAPTREDLEGLFAAQWRSDGFPDRVTEDTYRRRAVSLLEAFWAGELASVSEAIHEELEFVLELDAGPDEPPVRLRGAIDRIDRLPSGGVEVIDYKTGKVTSQKVIDENLQLSIYALACRDALGLGTPERVTLAFTEAGVRSSTTRTDEQLDAARDEIVRRARRIRSGDFTANPSPTVCRWCNHRSLCPVRSE